MITFFQHKICSAKNLKHLITKSLTHILFILQHGGFSVCMIGQIDIAFPFRTSGLFVQQADVDQTEGGEELADVRFG